MMTRLTKAALTAALAAVLLAPAGAQQAEELGPFHFTDTIDGVGKSQPAKAIIGDRLVRVNAETEVRSETGVTMPVADLQPGARVGVRLVDPAARPRQAAVIRVLPDDAELEED